MAKKSALQQVAEAQARIPIAELPDISKKLSVTIDNSITDNEILAIVSALSQAVNSSMVKHNTLCQIRHIKQTLNFFLNVDCTEEMATKGLVSLLSSVVNCDISFGDSTGADYHQTLNRDHIYNLAKPSGRAFAQAAAILVGSEASAVFDLSKYVLDQNINKNFENLITIVDSNYRSTLLSELQKFADKQNFVFDYVSTLDKECTYRNMIQQVIDSRIVIGPLSFYTYAAACLDIPVVEIFNTRDDLNIFSKWSSFKYAAILQEEITHFNFQRLDKAWSHWQGVDVNRQYIQLSSDG